LPAYELMFIVKPELDEEQVTAATDRVHQLVVANGGNVTKTAAWGKRRLAYQVGPFKEGYYVVSNFTVDADKIAELERVLKISDTVFRHLLVRREKPTTGQTEVYVPPASEDAVGGGVEAAAPPAGVEVEEEEAVPAAVAQEPEVAQEEVES
jgi:small subunit ribosomal protein S6